MDSDCTLQTAETLLQPWAEGYDHPEPNRLDVQVTAANLKSAVQELVKAHWGYLSAITGLDHPAPGEAEGEDQAGSSSSLPVEGTLEALYHFCCSSVWTTLRVNVPYSRPVIPSICDIIPSATLYERELMELFGVELPGTPSLQRLVLPDDWPDGVYPLRKSFTGFESPTPP